MSESEESGLPHPHDLLTRNILSDTDLAADLLRNYLDPHWVSLLDLGSLKREAPESVDRNLSELLGDLRYSGQFKGSGRKMNLFVFLEHQSRPDRLMSFRLLEYVCAAYRQYLFTIKKGKQATFPYPLVIVLHHGKKPWNRVMPMRELIDTVPGVESDILQLPVFLIDLASLSADQLRGHPAVCALLDSLQSASAGRLRERVQGIFGRLRDVTRDRRLELWFSALANYYASVLGDVPDIIGELTRAFTGLYTKKEAGNMALTMADALRLEGEAKGEVKGEVKGKLKAVISVLEIRFGEVPASLKKKISALQENKRIEKALKLATTCNSIKDFQKGL